MCANRVIGVLLGVLIGMLPAGAARANSPEDALKLAFTYNIARFVTWPEHTDSGDARAFHMCVLGQAPYRIAIDNLGNRRVDNLPIEVINLEADRAEGVHCDLAYLSADAGDLSVVVKALLPTPVLTVSDAPGFANTGGIIELTRRNDRIAMRINVAASRRAGLTISSQLLSLATVVSDELEAGS
ncbi:MAG: YfiR family protein [Pseudomonadota bacterium]